MLRIKNNAAFIVPACIIIAVFFFHYERYMEQRAYDILLDVDCNPATAICYEYLCDSESTDCVPVYYTKLRVQAVHVPLCAEQLACTALTCADFPQGSCEEYLCSEEYLAEGEQCSFPPPQQT